MTPAELRSIKSKIHNARIDTLHGSKGKISYAITFNIDTLNSRHGMSIGLSIYAEDEKILNSLDSTSLYSILLDPTITSSDEISLDVTSIQLGSQKIYQESKNKSLLSGSILAFLSLILLYFAYFKKPTGGS